MNFGKNVVIGLTIWVGASLIIAAYTNYKNDKEIKNNLQKDEA